MECRYILAGEDDYELLAELRIDFIRELHPEYDSVKISEIKAAAEKYIDEYCSKNIYTGFLGMIGDEVVCSGAFLIYDLPPLFSAEKRRTGHLLNFHTKMEYRKRGYGSGLMEFIKQYADDNGFHKIFLNASEAGYPLYKKWGFKESEKAMEYHLAR